MVLQQKAQAKQRERTLQQEMVQQKMAKQAANSGLSSKVYAKAA
jgi:hypothetical protein